MLLTGSCLLFSSALRAQSAASAASDDDDVVALSVFEVSTDRDRGYGSTNSIGATRVATPIENIPQSIITINEQFLEDIAPVEITDAAKYVSGISKASAPNNGQMTLRGFGVGGVSVRDGLDDPFGIGGADMRDLSTIARIEVIKGPAGVLYGSHSLGGVINTVSKKPEFRAHSEVKVTVGDYSLYRGEFDTTGPLGSSETLAYRVIGATQRGETFYGNPHDRDLMAGLLTYRPSNDTNLLLRFEYQHAEVSTSANAWFADPSGAFSTLIPIENVGDEHDEVRKHWNYSWELDFNHRLHFDNSSWTLRANIRLNDVDEDKQNYNKRSFRFVTADGTTLGSYTNMTIAEAQANPLFADIVVDRDWRRDLYNVSNRILNLDVVGQFEVGPTKHDLIAYFVADDSETDGRRRELADYPSISALNPAYSDNPAAQITNRRLAQALYSEGSGWAYGAQDQIATLEEKLVASIGARYSKRDATYSENRLAGSSTNGEVESDWVYRFGVVGKPAEGVALFYNYSETFNPVSGTDDNGVPWKNQLGVTNEGGVKLELLDSALTLTTSYFETTQDNFIRTIVNTVTGLPERVQGGQSSAEGWEADFAWQASPSISFFGGVGDIESVDEDGVRTQHVSQGLNYRIFGKWEAQTDGLKGLSAGLGYEYTNERAGDSADNFQLPDYGIVDAFVGYRRSNWNFQVNVYNLTDEIYAGTSVAAQFVYPGEPRKFRFTASYRF